MITVLFYTNIQVTYMLLISTNMDVCVKKNCYHIYHGYTKQMNLFNQE